MPANRDNPGNTNLGVTGHHVWRPLSAQCRTTPDESSTLRHLLRCGRAGSRRFGGTWRRAHGATLSPARTGQDVRFLCRHALTALSCRPNVSVLPDARTIDPTLALPRRADKAMDGTSHPRTSCPCTPVACGSRRPGPDACKAERQRSEDEIAPASPQHRFQRFTVSPSGSGAGSRAGCGPWRHLGPKGASSVIRSVSGRRTERHRSSP